MTDISTTTDYRDFLADLKGRVRGAQLRASLSVNRELILLYWGIGRDILARQASQGWGSKVVSQLSHDLRVAFPDMKGFSERNLLFMRRLAQTYPRPGRTKQLRNGLFHFCPGATTSASSTRSRTRTNASGTCSSLWTRAGA